MDTMYFAWLAFPVDVNPLINVPQFTLVDKLLYDCSQNYTSGTNFPLRFNFTSRFLGLNVENNCFFPQVRFCLQIRSVQIYILDDGGKEANDRDNKNYDLYDQLMRKGSSY